MVPVLLTRNLRWPRGLDLAEGLHRDFDRFVGRVFGESCDGGPSSYPFDVREDENHYYVEADVPGMTKDDVEIALENGVLTITGEKKVGQDHNQDNYHIRERRCGKFSREFTLPTAVDESQVSAVMKDGVLTITLNKREEVKPKRISVNVG